MKKKISKLFKNIGKGIATFLLFMPIYIIFNHETINNYWFYLICAIFYDFYIYSCITFDDYMTKELEKIEKIKNGNFFQSDTEEKKQLWYKTICFDIFNEYFNK